MTMKTLTNILLLLMISSPALSENGDTAKSVQEYDIEIIIFEDAHARYINNESWQEDSPSDSLTDITENNHTKQNLDELSISEINAIAHSNIKPVILENDFKRINNSSEYNVLFYSAWRQAGLKATNAFEININELENAHQSKSENNITGQLKVVLARYLHFYGKLNYQRHSLSQPPTPEVTASTENLEGMIPTSIRVSTDFPMTIHRRMRSKELHYIDHPLVGILLQINPVEKPKDL